MVCENSDEVNSGKAGLGPRFLASAPRNMTAERALLSRCPGQPCPGSLSKIPMSLLGVVSRETPVVPRLGMEVDERAPTQAGGRDTTL